VYNPKSYIDKYYEYFIQKKAGDAMDDMMAIIRKHMER